MPSTASLEVDVTAFAAAHRDGAYVIDVREPGEYVAGHVPGAKLVPLSLLADRAAELPRERTVFVVCASGNRSLRAASALAAVGVQATSVIGGTSAWRQAGHPVVLGRHEA